MGVILLLVICSVVAALVFLLGFLWATATGQYDDIHTPALRMLFPERPAAVDRIMDDPPAPSNAAETAAPPISHS